MKVRKLILTGTPDDRGRLEEFCQLLASSEHVAGARLQALAVELARLGGLEVSAVAYEDESLELEVVLPGIRCGSRSASAGIRPAVIARCRGSGGPGSAMTRRWRRPPR